MDNSDVFWIRATVVVSTSCSDVVVSLGKSLDVTISKGFSVDTDDEVVILGDAVDWFARNAVELVLPSELLIDGVTVGTVEVTRRKNSVIISVSE